jgi:biotin-(acetyl-CoA carboxylase) ligase
LGPRAEVPVALDALNASLARWVDADRPSVLAGFRERDALAGRRIAWEGGAGVAAGIDEAGHLLVREDGGRTVTLGAGEVHLAVGAG